MTTATRLIPYLLLSLAGAAVAQTTQPVAIPRTEQFDVLGPGGKTYRITIATPRERQPDAGYAVFYQLDANAGFATAVEAVRFQQNNVPALVVGIHHPQEKLDQARRYKDYTPHTSQENLAIRRLTPGSEGYVEPGGTGGQDEFLAFLETTVKPAIAARYKTDPTREAIFGHSLSARFVLHVLATRPEAFDYYLAASPSVWWDKGSVIGEIERFVQTPDAKKPAGVMITVGEYEQKPSPGTPPDRAAFFAAAKMVDNAKLVADKLKAAGVRTMFVEYPDENHGTVLPAAISRGVRFAFGPGPATQPSR